LVASELTAASALVFGQTAAAIPVAVIRGFQYEISETENISNTCVPQISDTDVAKAIKATLRATAYAHGLKTRLLLKIASWFI
jgi:F420-0:gamma-glutamyl ligase